MVQERRKLLAGCDERAFTTCRGLRHPSLSQPVPLPPLETFATRQFSPAARPVSTLHPFGHHKTWTCPWFPLFSRSSHLLRLGQHDWRPLSPMLLAAAPLPAKSRVPLNLRNLPQPPQLGI